MISIRFYKLRFNVTTIERKAFEACTARNGGLDN